MHSLPTSTLQSLSGGTVPQYNGAPVISCVFPLPDGEGTIGCAGPGHTTSGFDGTYNDGCFGTTNSSF